MTMDMRPLMPGTRALPVSYSKRKS